MERRQTKHKGCILELFAKHHVLSAQEVAAHMPDVDFSVVYRNLRRFVDDGMLHEVHTEPGAMLYELATHTHGHFVCDGCTHTQTVHLSDSTLRHLLPRGVSAEVSGVVIHGTCAHCAHHA